MVSRPSAAIDREEQVVLRRSLWGAVHVCCSLGHPALVMGQSGQPELSIVRVAEIFDFPEVLKQF